MMTDVACLCGCFYSFDAGAGACPKCGECANEAAVTESPDAKPGQQACHRQPGHSAGENAERADGADSMRSLALTFCPECELPAEVTKRFVLQSTDGPVDHVALRCLAAHHFQMPSEMLRGMAAELQHLHQPSRLGQ